MLNQNSKHLIDRKIYWKTKKRLKLLLLKIRSNKHNAINYYDSELQNLKVLRSITKETIWMIISTIIISSSLVKINKHLTQPLKDIGFSVPNDSDYVTLLSAIAGIGGVFIGLYYAALSSVGSSIYAKVPNNIRDLLAQERSGKVYMRFLSFMTLLCIALVVLKVCGLPSIISAVPVIGLMAMIGVVAFVKLGKNAFNLFDPTALSDHVFEDLHKWISIAKVNGFQWNDSAFQNHAHKKATRSVETLKLLMDLVAKETHQNGRSLVSLSGYTLTFLTEYEITKKRIPSQSLWYPEQFKHRDWYATSGYSVKIAHVTGTSLQPEVVRNPAWMEDYILPQVLRCIDINLNEGRYLETVTILNQVESYISMLAITGNSEKAFDLVERTYETIIRFISEQPNTNTKLNDLETLSIVATAAALPIAVALHLEIYAKQNSREILAKKLKTIKWNCNSSIYSIGLPTHLLPQLEWLHKRLGFETITEGSKITPFWYQLEMICLAESKALATVSKSFPDKAKNFFNKVSEDLQGGSKAWLCAAAKSSEHEFWHKAERTIDELEKNWLVFESERVLAELNWPFTDFFIIREGVQSHRRALLKSMANYGLLLEISEPPPDHPDYAGQFLHITGETLFSALCTNKRDDVRELFGTYLLGCFSRFDKLKPRENTSEDAEYKLRMASAVIIDLIELSGHAKLLSELYQNPDLWEIVKESWDIVLQDNAKTIPQYLRAVIDLSRTGYSLPHRSDLRFEWGCELDRLLDAVPRQNSSNEHFWGAETQVIHQSKLIQYAARGRHSNLPSGLNTFIVSFFIHLEGQSDFKLDWEQRDLLNSLTD